MILGVATTTYDGTPRRQSLPRGLTMRRILEGTTSMQATGWAAMLAEHDARLQSVRDLVDTQVQINHSLGIER